MNEITINKTNNHTEIKISVKGKLDNKIIEDVLKALKVEAPEKQNK